MFSTCQHFQGASTCILRVFFPPLGASCCCCCYYYSTAAATATVTATVTATATPTPSAATPGSSRNRILIQSWVLGSGQ